MILWLYLAGVNIYLLMESMFAPRSVSLIPLILFVLIGKKRDMWLFVVFSALVVSLLLLDDVFMYFSIFIASISTLFLLTNGKDIFLYPPYFITISNSIFVGCSILTYIMMKGSMFPIPLMVMIFSEFFTFYKSKQPIEGLERGFIERLVLNRFMYTSTVIFVFVTALIPSRSTYAVSIVVFLLAYLLVQKKESINSDFE